MSESEGKKRIKLTVVEILRTFYVDNVDLMSDVNDIQKYYQLNILKVKLRYSQHGGQALPKAHKINLGVMR